MQQCLVKDDAIIARFDFTQDHPLDLAQRLFKTTFLFGADALFRQLAFVQRETKKLLRWRQ